jgi:acetylornithine deacetylase/succinyl-diaminopimelate desuccinylase-like protein
MGARVGRGGQGAHGTRAGYRLQVSNYRWGVVAVSDDSAGKMAQWSIRGQSMTAFDEKRATARASHLWDHDVVPALRDYIRIPCVSPAYCATWAEDGDMDRAVELLRRWCEARPLPDLSVDVVRLEGRTPLLLVEVPAHDVSGRSAGGKTGDQDDQLVLFYGHLDKQPEMSGWSEGLGPWSPILDGERLYGRGSADDGYAMFAALSAIETARAAGGSHRRCAVLIEASEESGSPDLPASLDALGDRLGAPSLVVALDSGSATYDRLWVTTSLRGVVSAVLEVAILFEGLHSGAAGGIVPSSFRILRRLLDRIEDSDTGEVTLPELLVDVPTQRQCQIRELADTLGDQVGRFPLLPGARPMGETAQDRLLNVTWKPSVAVTGVDGLPPVSRAGNVLHPLTRVKLAVRLPPTCDAARAAGALERTLCADPPYGARIRFDLEAAEDGWNAPLEPSWLETALEEASRRAYGTSAGRVGEGGSIPFVSMLARRYPESDGCGSPGVTGIRLLPE